MRLLIITQKVDKNDDILGFFHRWLLEFAKHYEFVTVIALEVGEYDLSENVKVFSLGKEKSKSKIKYIFNFYKYIFRERKNYDAVFVHMNPIYVVLGGWLWRLWKKKIGLWYTHKSVDTKLRIAEKLADCIFTASSKSFRLQSKKLYVMGHGIDAEQFSNQESKVEDEKINILHVGRVSRAKNIHLFVEVAEILRNEGVEFQMNIVGNSATIREDKKYFKKLEKDILNKKLIKYFNFVGAVPPSDTSSYYRKNDIFINLSDTGSLDKAVLEAMASGIQVLVSNEAFDDILPEENKTTKEPKQIAKDIQRIANIKPNSSLREYILIEHDLKKLVPKLLDILTK